ncbi:MAG: hypothetical protein BWY74_03642 [Firmicutes bacterium ADurb.Bin419]|nr:MAG: hypothetical protein BWY74_03642 [Firmicutes bacterium ADurb.Bin419]
MDGEKPIELSTKEITLYEEKLLEYFKNVENSKPTIWETLKSIILGSVIVFSTVSIELSDTDRNFKPLKIFLDSNYIFSLLELDSDEINKAALELFQMLKKYGFDIKVFDITISEMISVLKNYIYNQSNYYEFVDVNSIYTSLKKKGFTAQDIIKYIQELEDQILTLGITIELTPITKQSFIP